MNIMRFVIALSVGLSAIYLLYRINQTLQQETNIVVYDRLDPPVGWQDKPSSPLVNGRGRLDDHVLH